MLKRPPIHFYYNPHNNFIPVEIVYHKCPHEGIYVVYVYTIYREGKGICFSSLDGGEENPFNEWFHQLKDVDIKTRLRKLHKLIRKLETIINERGIPFRGTHKTKPKKY